MDIYWIETGETKQRRGPVPVIEIVSMLERGELTPETKGWHPGCSAWLPLGDLPMLKSYFEKKAFKEQMAQEDREDREDREEAGEDVSDLPALSSSSPDIRVFVAAPLVVRCWARLFDLTLYVLIYFAAIRIFTDQFSLSFFRWWMWLPMPILEACSLAWWGTTPGKFLMGVQVRYCKGTMLTWLQAVRRSFYVLFFGLGMMTLFLTPIFVIFSWWYTRKNGISLWDRSLGSIVEVKDGERGSSSKFPWRLLWVVLLLFVMLELLGRLFAAWMPAMETLFRQSGM